RRLHRGHPRHGAGRRADERHAARADAPGVGGVDAARGAGAATAFWRRRGYRLHARGGGAALRRDARTHPPDRSQGAAQAAPAAAAPVAGRAPRTGRTRRSRGPIAQSGQSRRLITGRSQVRILVGPLPRSIMPTVEDAMTDAMTEIDRLAALQEVDRRLKDRRERMEALVSEADGYELEIVRRRELVSALTAERDALEQRRATMDRQLDISGGKIRDNRMRMNRVRNTTELLALQREIDLSKEANAQIEDELLRVMEAIETLTAQLSEAQAAVHELEAQADAAVAQRRAEAESLRQEVESERGARDSLASSMNPSLRSKYEQLFERRGGSAVVAARSGICTGCRMHIPPQLYNELQKHRDVVRQCPNCRRILFWRPEPGQ